MRKTQNLLFTIVSAIVLLFLLACVVYRGVVGYSQDEGRSYLEGRLYQALPALNAEDVANHTFQDAFEQFAADAVPFRNRIVLENAALQRRCIELSAALHGFEAYRTYYGSAYVATPQWGAVVEYPEQLSEWKEALIQEAAIAFSGLIERHSDVRWRMALVDRSRNAETSPVHDLVGRPADYAYYRKAFLDKLPDPCESVELQAGNTQEYFSWYFKTDHHWQVQGAYEAYRRIVESLGKEPVDMGFATAYSGSFFGASARSGRYTAFSDTVDDLVYEHSKLRVYFGATKQPKGALDTSWGSKRSFAKVNRYENVYASYFHGDRALIRIVNDSIEDDSALLIVGDSYTNNIERAFAEHYHVVYVIDPRHYQRGIDYFLDRHHVDDAVFLMASYTVASDEMFAALGVTQSETSGTM